MLDFIRRERIYVLILFFIVAVNLMQLSHVKKKEHGKRPLSSMSLEEIGVTEEKVKDFLGSERPSAVFFRYSMVFGFFIFIASLILNLIFVFRGRPLPLPSPRSCRSRLNATYRSGEREGVRGKTVPWGIPDIFRVALIVVFIGYVLAVAEAFILRSLHIDLSLNLRMILNTFFIDIAAAAVILYFVMIKYRERLEGLGLAFSSFFRNVLSGMTSYIFIVPFLLLVLVLSIWLLNILGYTPPPQPVFEVFMEEKRSNVLLFLTIFVSVLGPVVEELFFRGFMYSAIKKHTGTLAAAVLSGAVFSMLHTNIVGFLPIMILGVLLAYLYETTGSLVASMTVHIVHNSIIVGFVFFIKELVG